MSTLFLQNCRLRDRAETVDILIDAGRIVQIAPRIEASAAAERVDCRGGLVTPPFVESHIHLDSVLAAGQPRFNASGTLFEGIQIWGERKTSLTREDGVRSIHRIFDLAEQYGRLIDVHCDEVDDDQSRFLEVIVAEAIKRGGGERVSASHTTAFGSYNDSYAYKLLGFLRRTNINFIANPLINITLQGRQDSYPKRRGLTRIKELVKNGVNVSLGQDCIYDPWYIFGTGSMIGVAHMTVHVSQMTGLDEIDACFSMIAEGGARSLHIADYGIREGGRADLVVLPVATAFDALRFQVIPTVVLSQGRVIARNTQPVLSYVG